MATDTTPLRDAAVQMHEMFNSLTEAGFTESQAIAIIVGMANGKR